MKKYAAPWILAGLTALSGCLATPEGVDVDDEATTAEASQAARTPIPLPAGYWSFDKCSGSTVLNDSLRAPNATLYNGAGCGAGYYGSAGVFDGIDDRAEIADHVSVDFSSAMTVSAWVKPTATQTSQTIVAKWGTGDSSYRLFLSNGNYRFSVAIEGGSTTSVIAPATAGVFSHVAGVFDGLNVQIYVNGALAQSKAAPGTIHVSARPVTIGDLPGQPFAGAIDEVRLFSKELNAKQLERLAVRPSTLQNRGLHTYSSPWVVNPADMPSADPIPWEWFQRDLDIIQDIGNLNTVKTTLFDYGDQGPNRDAWLAAQNEKLSYLKAVAGNHVTWVFRAWPLSHDLQTNEDWYWRGYHFAQNLASTFYHIQSVLQLQNAYIEVGNEPNMEQEGFTTNGFPDKSAYNDFFRGFYDGKESGGIAIPLVYAGLSPGGTIVGTDNDREDWMAWYNDFWVRWHIENYAAKIGVHTYWTYGTRTSLTDGKSYRQVQSVLQSYGMPRKDMLITEANGDYLTYPVPRDVNQINDACQWWREAAQDRAAGSWIDQGMLYVTHDDDLNLDVRFGLVDSQIEAISSCQ